MQLGKFHDEINGIAAWETARRAVLIDVVVVHPYFYASIREMHARRRTYTPYASSLRAVRCKHLTGASNGAYTLRLRKASHKSSLSRRARAFRRFFSLYGRAVPTDVCAWRSTQNKTAVFMFFFRLREIRVILQECASFVDRANYTRSCNCAIESLRGDNLIERCCFIRCNGRVESFFYSRCSCSLLCSWGRRVIIDQISHVRSKIYSSSSRRIRKLSRSKILFHNCGVQVREQEHFFIY